MADKYQTARWYVEHTHNGKHCVRIDYFNNQRLCFIVDAGKPYSVIFHKNTNTFNCNCTFGSIHVGKDCSHILAVRFKFKNIFERLLGENNGK